MAVECGSFSLRLNRSGHRAHTGIYHSEPQPLPMRPFASVWINLKSYECVCVCRHTCSWLPVCIQYMLVCACALYVCICTIILIQRGKSLLRWQRWKDILSWMNPHKISPSINNHDWFQGHKLLQAKVWKSGTAHAQWPGLHQQSLKINTFF